MVTKRTVFKLLCDVDNPLRDKRRKDDWNCAVFKAGWYYVLEDIERKSDTSGGIIRYQRLVRFKEFGNIDPDDIRYHALMQHLQECEENFEIWSIANWPYRGSSMHAEDFLQGLINKGKITLEDVKQEWAELQERWK